MPQKTRLQIHEHLIQSQIRTPEMLSKTVYPKVFSPSFAKTLSCTVA